jgi:hypothetical protein
VTLIVDRIGEKIMNIAIHARVGANYGNNSYDASIAHPAGHHIAVNETLSPRQSSPLRRAFFFPECNAP